MFAQHLLEKKHFVNSMEDIMEILYITRKGSIINTFVKFHMYNETKLDKNPMIEKGKYNVIFVAVIHRNTYRGNPLV